MAKLVKQIYGDALFELALEENRLDEFAQEIQMLDKALSENPELTKVMSHPKITKEEKVELIEGILKGRIQDELTGLIRLMVEKEHYPDVFDLFSYFLEKVKEHKNIGTAYVTSAKELSEEQKEAIKNRLLETTSYVEFEMHYAVDEALIGGMKVRIGDRVADSSIATKLSNLTRELTKIQLKVGEGNP